MVSKPSGGGRDLPPLNFGALAEALLARAETLVPMWLPGGRRNGHEYICAGLGGGAGGSMAVNLKTGKWGEFAGDDRGNDLLGLYAAIHGLTMGKAAVQVAREYGLERVAGVVMTGDHSNQPAEAPRVAPPPAAPEPKAQKEAEQWRSLVPVPPDAPQPTWWHHSRKREDIIHRAAYRVGGQLLGYVVRFRTSDGGKETLPYTWVESLRDSTRKWHWRQWDEPRPLYYPAGEHPQREGQPPRTVVVVEGEIKAEVLQAMLEATAPGVYCVVSWPGGSKAWKKALWRWLQGSTVLLWPDCDSKREALTKAERDELKAMPADTPDEVAAQEVKRAMLEQAHPLLPEHKQPGMSAMLGIGAHLRDAWGCSVSILPIPKPGEVADGWDARDAIETDGWDGTRVLAFFGQAQPLPADEGDGAGKLSAASSGDNEAAAGGGGGGKKIEGPADAEEEDAGRKLPWWLKPYWDAEKQRWHVSRKLVIAALENDSALQDVFRLNLLRQSVDVYQPGPWLHSRAGQKQSGDELLMGDYLSRTYGLPAIAINALKEGVETVSRLNPYHPVRDWLKSLQWDGRARIDKWLIHVLGEDPERLSSNRARYLAAVGRYILLGLVNRVMQPGCKFDYMPVFEGQGGRWKSTLISTLVGKAYFSDTRFDLNRIKDGMDQMRGLWGYEFGELAGVTSSNVDVEHVKAFLSSPTDRYRAAYGDTVEDFPRQVVLFGTTNHRRYLRDRTGNRRFWPVPVRYPSDIQWLEKYRAQLFAEAFVLFGEGARYYPTPDEELELFKPMQHSRMTQTSLELELVELLSRPAQVDGLASRVNGSVDWVSLPDLVKALDAANMGKASANQDKQITAFLRAEGWADVRKTLEGRKRSVWLRPKGWPGNDDGDLDEDEDLDGQSSNAMTADSPRASTVQQASSGGATRQEGSSTTPTGDADEPPF